MSPLLVLDVPGWVGSGTDVATLVSVLYFYRGRLMPRLDTASAGLVAMAENMRPVDHEALQDDLDVDDEEIDAVRPTIVCDGETNEAE